MHSATLICKKTGEQYPSDARIWQSSSGGILDLEFTPSIDPGAVARRKPNLWRYREALPLAPDAPVISFEEGFTPLLELELDGHRVLVKQDHLFPSGSYKDRGASVMVSQIAHLGIHRVVEDSSGNAGCAVAAYCARAGIGCDVFVPASTSPQKLMQLQAYGAGVHPIQGSREDAEAAALSAAENSYYASHSRNPFFYHGTKTFAYEVAEQLGWTAPDTLVLPAGNGTLLLGAYIGFREMFQSGLLDRIPRLIAVQSSSCCPVYDAFVNGGAGIQKATPGVTVAEGIAIAAPVRGAEMIAALHATMGDVLIVDDREVVEALRLMARKGFFIEPTAAATIAGLRKYVTGSHPGETIVSVFTGHGLKKTISGSVASPDATH